VALSRARRIDHIVLSGLTLRALNHIDADALQFYQKSTARAARARRPVVTRMAEVQRR
jgi:hypothetical protein